MPEFQDWPWDLTFSQLTPGRYTFFAIDGLFGPVAMRVPVDLKQGETKSLQLGFPVDSGEASLEP